MLGPVGLFEILVNVGEGVLNDTHDDSSTHPARTTNVRVPKCGGPGSSASANGENGPRGGSRVATARLLKRGQEATRGAVEREALVLIGHGLTETRQSLDVAPDGTRIRLVLLRQYVRRLRCALFEAEASCASR